MSEERGRVQARFHRRREVTRMSDSTSHTEAASGPEQEEPMSRATLDTPEMKARIAKAQSRTRLDVAAPGKTADDLLELAREQPGVDSRT
jgi:hypothetical protein